MDKRLIHNISDFNAKAIAIVEELKPVQFELKGTNEKQIGLIAQEVQTVPYLVKNSGGILKVDYEKLTVYLLDAIKELKQEIEILKANNSKKKKIKE